MDEAALDWSHAARKVPENAVTAADWAVLGAPGSGARDSAPGDLSWGLTGGGSAVRYRSKGKGAFADATANV